MLNHDVAFFASGLSAKLATRSRHVCTFFGAGTSKACGLPDVQELTTAISRKLEGQQLAAFGRITATRNLEQGLSRLRRIQAVVEDDDVVDGLTGDEARALDQKICQLIIEALNSAEIKAGAAEKFAAWVARADYVRPLELFTVNYDCILEQALESREIPYFDGFVGSLRAPFRTDMVEAAPAESETYLPSFCARIWKLHGSVNWIWDTSKVPNRVYRLGSPVSGDEIAAIFPSDAKYEESRRMPFVVLQDRLRRALNEPETLVLISGYSWADDHLNELFFDAATRHPRSEFVAFCYSEIPGILADHAIATPNLQVVTQAEAILGGLRASWGTPDENTMLPPDIWSDNAFRLGDFSKLADFLARSSTDAASDTGPLSLS